MAQNVYQIITDRITEQMSQGIIPWQKPWHGVAGGAVSYETQKPYSFLNQCLLGRDGEWLTFNQVKKAGGNVRKGAKAGIVTFFKSFDRVQENEDGTTESKKSFVLQYYHVFHIDDCEGVKSKRKEDFKNTELHPIETAETVVNEYVDRETTLTLQVTPSNRAYFAPAQDLVVVPTMEQYDHIEEYYSTLFHELVHSTGVSQRCDRGLGKIASKSDEYSREELVAEMGSAMICNILGIDSEKAFNNSVAYIQSWLRALRNDNRMIVWAASRAEKAVKYIQGIKTDSVAVAE